MSKYKIDRIFNDESDLIFKIKFPEGKSFADVQDIIFIVKENDEDSSTNALVQMLQSEGDITTTGNYFANVIWEISDYSELEIGNSYRAALFCKWNGNNDFDENIEQIYDIEIKQDFHNN